MEGMKEFCRYCWEPLKEGIGDAGDYVWGSLFHPDSTPLSERIGKKIETLICPNWSEQSPKHDNVTRGKMFNPQEGSNT